MDLGKLLGDALGAGANALCIAKWMEISNPATLRFTIRNDIRGFQTESIKSILRMVRDQLRNYEMMNRPKMRDQALMVQETLIEEAERSRLL